MLVIVCPVDMSKYTERKEKAQEIAKLKKQMDDKVKELQSIPVFSIYEEREVIVMSTNKNLHNARNAKNDEFYTQLTDVAKELMHYKHHFKDKIVFCNCDDSTWSAFWKYFHLNFSALGLKKLISTHYDKNKPTYKMEYTGGDDNDIEVGVKTPLEGNGDFRNQECLDLLDEADIVVTNPPFSLFREYVACLMAHEKKFLIIGNKNAITYKEFFPLIKEDKVWLGYASPSEFNTPDGITKKLNGLTRWFTNLDHKKRHEKLILWKNYTSEEYPTYDNYDAINVDKVDYIPCDYEGIMGVPITFLDKYNPEQFEIIGIDCGDMGVSYGVGAMLTKEEVTKRFNEHKGFRRGKLCYRDEDGKLQVCYRRILIRRKKDT